LRPKWSSAVSAVVAAVGLSFGCFRADRTIESAWSNMSATVRRCPRSQSLSALSAVWHLDQSRRANSKPFALNAVTFRAEIPYSAQVTRIGQFGRRRALKTGTNEQEGRRSCRITGGRSRVTSAAQRLRFGRLRSHPRGAGVRRLSMQDSPAFDVVGRAVSRMSRCRAVLSAAWGRGDSG